MKKNGHKEIVASFSHFLESSQSSSQLASPHRTWEPPRQSVIFSVRSFSWEPFGSDSLARNQDNFGPLQGFMPYSSMYVWGCVAKLVQLQDKIPKIVQNLGHLATLFVFCVRLRRNNNGGATDPSAFVCHPLSLVRMSYLCPCSSTRCSVRSSWRPASGMYHSLTVQSSEAEAMMLSLNGFHFMSFTWRLWPET